MKFRLTEIAEDGNPMHDKSVEWMWPLDALLAFRDFLSYQKSVNNFTPIPRQYVTHVRELEAIFNILVSIMDVEDRRRILSGPEHMQIQIVI